MLAFYKIDKIHRFYEIALRIANRREKL